MSEAAVGRCALCGRTVSPGAVCECVSSGSHGMPWPQCAERTKHTHALSCRACGWMWGSPATSADERIAAALERIATALERMVPPTAQP